MSSVGGIAAGVGEAEDSGSRTGSVGMVGDVAIALVGRDDRGEVWWRYHKI